MSWSRIGDVDACWVSLYAKPTNHLYWEPDLNQIVAPEAVEGRDFESAPAICVPEGVAWW